MSPFQNFHRINSESKNKNNDKQNSDMKRNEILSLLSQHKVSHLSFVKRADLVVRQTKMVMIYLFCNYASCYSCSSASASSGTPVRWIYIWLVIAPRRSIEPDWRLWQTPASMKTWGRVPLKLATKSFWPNIVHANFNQVFGVLFNLSVERNSSGDDKILIFTTVSLNSERSTIEMIQQQKNCFDFFYKSVLARPDAEKFPPPKKK